jgi:hypothetical protein
LLLLLRGAFVLALACFLFSPAPVLVFPHGGTGMDQGRLSLSWLGVVVIVVAAVSAVFALVVYLGGLPQVHQWPAALRGGR